LVEYNSWIALGQKVERTTPSLIPDSPANQVFLFLLFQGELHIINWTSQNYYPANHYIQGQKRGLDGRSGGRFRFASWSPTLVSWTRGRRLGIYLSFVCKNLLAQPPGELCGQYHESLLETMSGVVQATPGILVLSILTHRL